MPESLVHALKPWLLALALPPTPALILAMLGAGCIHYRRRAGWPMLVAALAAVWLGATDAAADRLQAWLLGPVEVLAPAQAEQLRNAPATVILVLGGGAIQDSPEYGGATLKPLSLERLRYGAWLARQTGLPLAYTGGIGWGGKDDARAEGPLAVQVVEQEYGMKLLFAEGASRDTRENARLSLPLLRQHGIGQVVLVTHVQHMPRSLRAFREAANEAAVGGELSFIPAPVGSRDASKPLVLGDWLPTAHGFSQCRYAVYEWLGLLMGH
jgi:uncharacterized SAM-binding protein YcdF (DUF218 family)